MPGRVTDQRKRDHKAEEERHEAEQHRAGDQRCPQGHGLRILRQALTLVSAAVTTSTRSIISSGTATADTAKTIAANAIPTPVPTIRNPTPAA